MTYRVELKNHPVLGIHADSKEEFRAILNDYITVGIVVLNDLWRDSDG